MLTHVRLKNFKGWRDTGDVRLAPITVFFGGNSTGKSSLSQFLLMLKQTAQSSDRRRVLHTGDDDSLVELGSYRDFVYRHDTSLALEWELGWRRSTALDLSDTTQDPPGVLHSGTDLRFECAVDQRDDQTPRVRRLSHHLTNRQGEALEVGMGLDDGGTEYELSDAYQFERKRGRPVPVPAPDRFYGFPSAVQVRYQHAEFLDEMELALEDLLTSVRYLGPLRDHPKRTYLWSGVAPPTVGPKGEDCVPALLASEHRKLVVPPRKKSEPFQKVIARWLKTMGLIASFELVPIAEHHKYYEARVQAAQGAASVTLADVGFGVSQVLPVIVECFYANPDSILLLEQPEIHLHPSVQSNLADLFIAAIGARERGKDRRMQLVVESHSEHFLRRLQRRIAEGALSKDDAALYFCTTGAKGSELTELDIDMFGNIRNWPEEFFGDEMGDLVAMAEAAAESQAEADGE